MKELAKPIYDTDDTFIENAARYGKGFAKGALGVAGATATVAAQAVLSATDGKYTAKEAVASAVTGAAMGGKVYRASANFLNDVRREYNYSSGEENRRKQAARDWAERKDIREKYKETYGNNSAKLLKRAENTFAQNGITDVNVQKQLFRYSNYLIMQNSNLSKKEADKMAVDVYKFRQNARATGGVPNSDETKKEFIKKKIEQNKSSKSKGQLEKYYSDMIDKTEDFESVRNDNSYDEM